MTLRKVMYFIIIFAIAALMGFGVYAFIRKEIAGGIILFIVAVGFAFELVAMVMKDRLNRKCGAMFQAKEYAKEREYLERVRKSPLSFLTRLPAMSNYVCVCMALDDLPAALRIIDRLRHGGGAGWKYRTAYCYILIKLDGGDVETARAEYEEFRTQCANAQIYREQIEVLTAIFHRLFKTDNTEPLPEAAVNSDYPVVGRILGRVYEERVANSGIEWD